MSELSRSILAGTSQVAGAYSGLANLRAVNRERKRKAMAGIGDSLAELGQTLKDYGSWRDAKRAEDETRQVDDAYALGMQTGEPEKALVTLGAVRPTTAAAATLRAKRMDMATEAARKRNADKLDEAQQFLHRQQYENDLKATQERLGISRAELELAQKREARLGAEPPPPRNIDPLSPEGIAAAEEKARRVGTAEASVKAATPKEPDGLDQPLPPKTRALLEQKAGLKTGSLEGFTFRDWNAMRSDPQEEMLKQLRVIAAQRDAAEHEPPKLKAARKELDRLRSRLDAYRNTMTTASIMADKKAMAAREKELADAVTSQEGVVAAEEKAAADSTLEVPTKKAAAGDEEPTPADIEKAKAMGLTWDPATRTFR